jgi:hypothetical protein
MLFQGVGTAPGTLTGRLGIDVGISAVGLAFLVKVVFPVVKYIIERKRGGEPAGMSVQVIQESKTDRNGNGGGNGGKVTKVMDAGAVALHYDKQDRIEKAINGPEGLMVCAQRQHETLEALVEISRESRDALLELVSLRRVYRRTRMTAPDVVIAKRKNRPK